MRTRTFTIAVLILGAALPALYAADKAAAPPDAEAARIAAEQTKKATGLVDKVAIIYIRDMIDDGLAYSIRRRVEHAREAGAKVIIFDVDTLGGLLSSAFDIVDYVSHIDVKTVAFVSKEAISAGALFCVACNEIVMAPDTRIGDCQPIIPSAEKGYIEVGEKGQTFLRARFRSLATLKGYPPILCEAMVTKELGVWRVTRDGKREYLTNTQYQDLIKGLGPKEVAALEAKLIVREGELLTMTSREAVEYGFARQIVADQKEAVALYLKPGGTAGDFETNWSEEMVRFLTHPAVTGVLVTVGLIALYFAFKIPGLGIPELIAVLCFGTLFLSRYLIGMATAVDIILFGAGIILLAVEVFVIPGFGVTGILGILCIGAGLVLMMQRFTLPKFDYEYEVLVRNLVIVVFSMVGSLVGFLVLARLVPSAPGLHRLTLKAEQTVAAGYTAGAPELEALAGKKGVALTDLHPTGRVEIGDQSYDVVTQGDYLEAGAPVKVIEVRGNRIVVGRA